MNNVGRFLFPDIERDAFLLEGWLLLGILVFYIWSLFRPTMTVSRRTRVTGYALFATAAVFWLFRWKTIALSLCFAGLMTLRGTWMIVKERWRRWRDG